MGLFDWLRKPKAQPPVSSQEDKRPTSIREFGGHPPESPAHGLRFDWPPLAGFSGVTGRPATEEDVKAGRAVFVVTSSGVPIGVPLGIVVPQYALHRDEETGEVTPCVVVQAEQAGPERLVGCLLLPGRDLFAGKLAEFTLLGINPPTSV